jgi:hypothetical protein
VSLLRIAISVFVFRCNVNGRLLIEFLEENAEKSIRLQRDVIDRQAKLENLKIELIAKLKLKQLEWEPNISTEDLLDCMYRLKKVGDAVRNQIQGLSVKISSNSNYYILADAGTVSIPHNFSE